MRMEFRDSYQSHSETSPPISLKIILYFHFIYEGFYHNQAHAFHPKKFEETFILDDS
jgi:hypothetical protein